ncbi:MAG: acyltransferase family protein [bacterium]|nr:acyltransferase family protein [bacterium]
MNNQQRDTGYDFIRFLAMLMIMVFHFCTTCIVDLNFKMNNFFIDKVIFHGNIDFGKIGVGLFFMLSGAVLLMTDKGTVGDYYKRRLKRLYYPLWISFILLFFVSSLVSHKLISTDIIGTIVTFFGLDYCGPPWTFWDITPCYVIGEWFTTVIILLSVLFPVLKWMFAKARLISTIIIFLIFALNLKLRIMTGYGGAFSLTYPLMFFWLGMCFQYYKKYLNNKIIICNLILLIVLWFVNPTHFLGFWILPSFVFDVLLFTVLYKINFSNWFTKFICKYNYELYLVHHRIYFLFFSTLLTVQSSSLRFVSVGILSITVFCMVSIFIHYLSNKLQKLTTKLINEK